MNLINIILCLDKHGNYGKDNGLPWSKKVSIESGDMKLFKNITTGNSGLKKNVVIMGRLTWESLNKKSLVDRYNIIVCNNLANWESKMPDTIFVDSLSAALLFVNRKKNTLNIGDVFIIGGKSLWTEALERKLVSNVFLSIMNINNYDEQNKDSYKQFDIMNNRRFDKDFKKKEILLSNKLVESYRYELVNKEELIFLKTLEKIKDKGIYKMDRSGVGTKSLFGKSFTYDIRNYRLPLFTHRKVFIRGIIEELLFFISGKTNTKSLESRGVNIWKGHTSREYLDKVGLQNLEEGSYGPAYGFQLRNWGADFISDDYDYSGKGFDQLHYVLELLKNKETRNSRRILFSYWNPSVLDKVPLPSCHLLYNFFVNPETEELSVSFYQRSNDYALAGVFNIVSASILTFMLCQITGLKPGKCIHNIGDLHLYNNQLEVVSELIENKPNIAFPFMHISNNGYSSLDEFRTEDFEIILYNSRKKYQIPFSV